MATSSGLALRTLASRRAALTAHNPRQIAVPMVTPILFALVLAPALKDALGGLHNSIDYTAFVAVGTVGLLVPLATTFAGLSVIVDRDSGAQRELLAAPIPRPLLVAGNLVVVLGLCALQVVVVIAAAALRGADFHVRAAGVVWFVLAVVLFVVLMYGIAETLAARIQQQEEYIGATPVIAILPWFFAGALFPISALPGALTAFAKMLPLTHAMALMRYGLVDPRGTGLHDIWGMSNTTTEAWLSLAVVVLFAAAFAVVAVRAFTRAAVR
ncbi:MAG TPA: ABC transporter permease [Solirubrobacteraceae bacterium]|nr:ABC transporter permease [Solirubrobacteraceae bacterium]